MNGKDDLKVEGTLLHSNGAVKVWDQLKIVLSFVLVLALVFWVFFRLETFRNIQVQRTADDAAQWEAIESVKSAIDSLQTVMQSNSERVESLTKRVDILVAAHVVGLKDKPK